MNLRICIIPIMCLLVLISCTKDPEIKIKELDPTSDAALIEKIKASGDPGIPFPKGSTAIQLPDGRMKITLPKGYKFLISEIGTNNVPYPDDGGAIGVTCTCTKGTGCSPVVARGKYYCVMEDGCDSCTKTTSLIEDGEHVDIMGVYNPSLSITLLSKEKQTGILSSLTSQKTDLIGNATSALFKLESTRSDLLKLYKFIYGNDIPSFITNNESSIPKGYKYVAINIYGNAAAIPVPESQIDEYAYVYPGDDGSGGSKVTCKCNDDVPQGCTKKTYLAATYCEAGNCRSCSLND